VVSSSSVSKALKQEIDIHAGRSKHRYGTDWQPVKRQLRQGKR
jgi:hypothetical protein